MRLLQFYFHYVVGMFVVSCVLNCCVGSKIQQLKLHEYLLGLEYSPDVLPICDDKNVSVNIDVALREIVEVTEKLQLVRLKIWVRLYWRDCVLKWNESNFDNISSIVLPYDNIWVPDITLYEGISDEANMPDKKEYRAQVTYDGNIAYLFPSIVTIACRMDVTYFPFDNQICSLKFGSWAYSGKEIDINFVRQNGDLISYVKHNEWEVLSFKAKKHLVTYSCCPYQYPDVTFYLHIRRESKFFIVTILFPCFLVTALTFMGFVLPPVTGEKITLQITVLLSITVFLLLVQDKLPSSSDTLPYIAVYYAVSMTLVCLSCVLSAIVLYVYYRDPEEHKISVFCQKVFLTFLRKWMCIKSSKIPKSCEYNIQEAFEFEMGKPKEDAIQMQNGKLNSGRNESTTIYKQTKEEVNEKTNTNEFGNGEWPNEWQLMALVLDRFFLWLYVALSLVNTTVFIFLMLDNPDMSNSYN